MEPPVVPDGEVTLAGAGHHADSLNDVETARRASVLAYCARLCDPDSIAGAADAAFAEFRRVLETAAPDSIVELDRALLEATRDAAAARVDATAAEPAGRLGSRRAGAACSVMPTLLAGRASGRLSSSDREGVERHLSRCARCRSLERRREEAEQAYAALLGTPVPGGGSAVAEPIAAVEPFAPGDPEPEVTATGPLGLGDPPAWEDPRPPAEARAEWVEAEPVAGEHVEWLEPEPVADTAVHDALQPEAAPSYEGSTAVVPPADDDPPPAAAYQPPPAASGDGSRRRGRLAIFAIIGAGLVFLAIGIVQILSGDDSASTDRPARPAAQSRPAAPAPAPAADPAPTRAQLRTRARLRAMGDRELGPGTTGPDVKALQKLLGVQPTGTYGELTTYAVGQFQASNDLPSTGIADAATKRRLARRRKPPAAAPVPPATQAPESPSDGSAGPAPSAGDGTEGSGTPPADGGADTGTPPAPEGATTPPAPAPGGTGTPGQ